MAGSDHHHTVLHIQLIEPEYPDHIRHQGPTSLHTPLQEVLPHSRSDIRVADYIL
jgi:hypothetical protein